MKGGILRMRGMKNKLLLILIVLSLVLLIGCSNTKDNIPDEDEEIIENFFISYFEQLKYTDEEWETLIDLIQSNKLEEDLWLTRWNDTLTERELKRLVNNRLLPNLYLREHQETEYKIEGIMPNGEDSYSVNIVFKGIGKENEKRTINVLVNLIDTEQGRRIDYVDLMEFSLLFK